MINTVIDEQMQLEKIGKGTQYYLLVLTIVP